MMFYTEILIFIFVLNSVIYKKKTNCLMCQQNSTEMKRIRLLNVDLNKNRPVT